MTDEPLPPTLRTRVALVTGGGRRVGKAIAIELARRGARVAVHANSSIDEANELCELLSDRFGADAMAFQADLSDIDACGELVERVARRFARHGEAGDEHAGRLDVLVNCAAIWPKEPFDEFDPATARKSLEVNTLAPLVLAHAAGERMIGQPTGGVIVNLGDVATGHDGAPYPGYFAYHPSKAAVPGMTRALAVELAKRNPRVRANCVLPGPVICQHLPGEPEEPAERRQHARDCALTATPDEGGYGRAEHVAHAVALLIENPFLNGVELPVDGGGRLR